MKNVNVEVVKNANESPTNLIRRFTKRVQGAGVLMRVRGIRYNQRPVSKFKRKKKALAVIAKKVLIEHLDKIGKPMIFKKKGRR
ncbi:MAG: 30S ribosomal protein S21 [bacterium]|nr:30S ribosomal protein S21 [bacterium]